MTRHTSTRAVAPVENHVVVAAGLAVASLMLIGLELLLYHVIGASG